MQTLELRPEGDCRFWDLVLVGWFGGGRMGWGFSGWCGCAVQNVESGLGHGLVGISEEEADLPQLGVAELSFERRHPS